MPQTMIQLSGALTGGTENAIAVIDIPADGVIEGVDMSIRANLDGDDESVESEMSFIATNQIGTNDARGILTTMAMHSVLTTSGVGAFMVNKYVPMELEVSGGERIYLHCASSAGTTGRFNAIIQLRLFTDQRRRSRRR